MSQTRRIRPEEWNDCRALIEELYITQRISMTRVLEMITTDHFEPTIDQLRRQILVKWGLRRNLIWADIAIPSVDPLLPATSQDEDETTTTSTNSRTEHRGQDVEGNMGCPADVENPFHVSHLVHGNISEKISSESLADTTSTNGGGNEEDLNLDQYHFGSTDAVHVDFYTNNDFSDNESNLSLFQVTSVQYGDTQWMRPARSSRNLGPQVVGVSETAEQALKEKSDPEISDGESDIYEQFGDCGMIDDLLDPELLDDDFF